MLNIPFPDRILLYRFPTDMRKSFEGLCGIIINELGQDPVRDGMFAFINKRRDRIKLLIWDRHGYWLLYKRLEQGRLQQPATGVDGNTIPIGVHELSMVIEGIDINTIKRKKRFKLPSS